MNLSLHYYLIDSIHLTIFSHRFKIIFQCLKFNFQFYLLIIMKSVNHQILVMWKF